MIATADSGISHFPIPATYRVEPRGMLSTEKEQRVADHPRFEHFVFWSCAHHRQRIKGRHPLVSAGLTGEQFPQLPAGPFFGLAQRFPDHPGDDLLRWPDKGAFRRRSRHRSGPAPGVQRQFDPRLA